jgi:hypothetical protein
MDIGGCSTGGFFFALVFLFVVDFDGTLILVESVFVESALAESTMVESIFIEPMGIESVFICGMSMLIGVLPESGCVAGFVLVFVESMGIVIPGAVDAGCFWSIGIDICSMFCIPPVFMC